MGEVYRARDTRLDRLVAIKVIPPELAGTPEARARFEREARVISSLNHPHICTLFDVGREGDAEFLVMEFLEGETLAARLQRGPLSVAETARIAAQVADALDRAHRQGITHRDLKPANIMLTKGGAKLLDFGLARGAGLSASTGGLSQTPTMTTPLTTQGAIVGTLEYMAPEQLEGKEVDARTDIWAMGLILYEMLSGRRPFQSPSQAGLIAAILERTPTPLATLAPGCPPGLIRLVDRCLVKDPDDRWQSARDLMHELRELAGSTGAPVSSVVMPPASGSMPAMTATGRRPAIPLWVLLLAAFGIGAAAMLGATLTRRPHAREAGVVRFTMTPSNGVFMGNPAEPTISPDGRRIAYGAIDTLGTLLLCVRTLDAVESRRVPGSEGAWLPFWSPDGQWVAFFAKESLLKVPVDGGTPVTVAAAPDGRGGVWLPGGDIVFAPNREGGLERVNAAGGKPEPFTTLAVGEGELGHRYPALLPDGKHVTFVAIHGDGQHHAKMIDLTGRKVTDLGPSASAFIPVPGYFLSLEGSNELDRLQIRPFEGSSGKPSGPARRLLDDVSSNNIGYHNAAANARMLVVQKKSDIWIRLQWQDVRDGSGPFIGREKNLGDLVLSPDGRRVVMMMGNNFDLWTLDLASGERRRLTSEPGFKMAMVWSPDGRQVAFAQQGSEQSNSGYEVRLKSADGAGAARTLFRGPGIFSRPMGWTADGRELLVCASDTSALQQLFVVPVDGGGKPRVHLPLPGGRTQARLSPDGRWLAYLTVTSGRSQAWIESYPDAATRFQVSTDGAIRVEWMADGRQLAWIDPGLQLWVSDVSVSAGLTLGPPRKSFVVNSNPDSPAFDVHGTRILMSRPEWETFGGPLEIILGWQALIPAS
jgi:Tol biopolymer transport system component